MHVYDMITSLPLRNQCMHTEQGFTMILIVGVILQCDNAMLAMGNMILGQECLGWQGGCLF